MVSPRTVAIVDQGKQRDVSRGCGRRRRQTVTVGESKGKNEFIYGLIKRHDPERAVLSLRLHPHDRFSWLNTSKDPVVGNEQRSGAFWSRIAAYFEESRESQGTDAGCEQRELTHCKQRWHKINDLVSKFCGAYEAATRGKSSGQNENDVLKLAHQIFYNNHQKRFMLDHAWKELRNDQKWCAIATAKRPSSKKRKCDDGGDSSASQATENKRPAGVKAAKASSKKKVQDLLMKERLPKMSLPDSLIGKQEPLAEYEEALKKKLITDLMST
ncbi:PREDICTED: glutathione S-transferase T3-like [Brassica oleracea var. oleracea]|uniref:No apical meristem-associated C-terminal domain-containing protein n=1 Tax=Brassica oleracea var. oleracea TaxID=109376 RepID=A0A0D3AWC2_BRAOL|nr:PREDICTED: glutathione S-transferase T3-like [Brassica oleracea var. oleracea]